MLNFSLGLNDDTSVFLLSFCFLSSVGLAKAALEAINGFNLFGNQVIKIFAFSLFFFFSSKDLYCGSEDI